MAQKGEGVKTCELLQDVSMEGFPTAADQLLKPRRAKQGLLCSGNRLPARLRAGFVVPMWEEAANPTPCCRFNNSASGSELNVPSPTSHASHGNTARLRESQRP